MNHYILSETAPTVGPTTKQGIENSPWKTESVKLNQYLGILDTLVPVRTHGPARRLNMHRDTYIQHTDIQHMRAYTGRYITYIHTVLGITCVQTSTWTHSTQSAPPATCSGNPLVGRHKAACAAGDYIHIQVPRLVVERVRLAAVN